MVALGTFVLHSFVKPPVTAGRYQLHGTQPMDGITVGEHVADVLVSSPRYTMPPDQILSTFPPAMAEGDFGTRLPQIALKRRTLPWERDPGGPALGAHDPPRPWLALVVLAEGEGALSADPAPVAECVTPGTVLPHPEDADSPTGYSLTVTETVVNKVFPTVEDLPLLVHVREVDLRDTELANGDDDGWLAVVLANRLPIAVPATDPHSGQPVSAPVRYLACLLNLEGQVDALPTDADLDTDDTFHLVAAVQDLSLVATTAASTDLVVMGTGHPVPFGAVPLEVEAVDAEAAIARATSVVAAGAATPGDNAAVATWASPAASPAAKATTFQAVDAGVAVRKEMAGGWAVEVSPFVLEKTYRFPVLAHWSFTATNDGDFRSIVQALDVGLLGTEYGTVLSVDPNGTDPTEKVEHVHLPDPKAPPRPAPPELAETGHVALPADVPAGASPPPPGTAGRSGRCPPTATRPTARWPTSATSCAPSPPTAVRTSASRRRSRSAGCSASRSRRWSPPLVRWRSEQFGAARAQAVGDVVSTATPFAPDATRPGPRPRPAHRPAAHDHGRCGARRRSSARPARSPTPVARSSSTARSTRSWPPGSASTSGGCRSRPARRGWSPRSRAPTSSWPAAGASTRRRVAGLRATLDSEVTRIAKVAAAGRLGTPGVVAEAGIEAGERSPEVEPDALDDLLDDLLGGLQRGGAVAVIMARFDATVALDVQLDSASSVVVTNLTETDPDDGDHVVPGAIRRALAELRLLSSVPFSYLVPDASLLPPESMRFFYLDRNWTDALVEGVLSIGTFTDRGADPAGGAARGDPRRGRRDRAHHPPARRRGAAVRSRRRDQRVPSCAPGWCPAGPGSTSGPTAPTASRTPRSSPSPTPTG